MQKNLRILIRNRMACLPVVCSAHLDSCPVFTGCFPLLPEKHFIHSSSKAQQSLVFELPHPDPFKAFDKMALCCKLYQDYGL